MNGSDDDFLKAQERGFRAYAESLTVRTLDFSESDNLVFLDEVGNVKPSKEHSALHFCGIAVSGAEYRKLKREWIVTRTEVFRIGQREDFSSAKQIRRLFASTDAKCLNQLYGFINVAPFHPVMSWHPHQGMFVGRGANEEMAVATTVSVIADQTKVIFGSARQIWIVEHSTSLPWKLLQNQMTGDPMLMPPPNVEVRFMKKKQVFEPGPQRKKAIEPGLDLADICAFLWSKHVESGALEGFGDGSEYDPLYQVVLRKFRGSI